MSHQGTSLDVVAQRGSIAQPEHLKNFQNNLEPRFLDAEVTIRRIDQNLADLVIPVSVLGILILCFLILILIFIVYGWNFLERCASKRKSDISCGKMDAGNTGKHMKVQLVKDDTVQKIENQILNDIRYIDELSPDRINDNVVKTRNYGGSPKTYEDEECTFSYDESKPGCSSDSDTPRLTLPMPEKQFMMHKTPSDYKYFTIPRPLGLMDVGDEYKCEGRYKFSSTRSPSLEKDEKSPFVASAKSDKSDVFGFDVEHFDSDHDVSPDNNNVQISPSPHAKMAESNNGNTNLKRYCSVNNKLHLYSVSDNANEVEQMEVQNSPQVFECSSAKEKYSGTRFNFSPMTVSEKTPRFFPESPRSPKMLSESPKNVEHRKVYSPQMSPRISTAKCKSPKVLQSNKENYFNFDPTSTHDYDMSNLECVNPSNRRASYIQKYSGRKSIEREFVSSEKCDPKKYRRHNSCENKYFDTRDSPESVESAPSSARLDVLEESDFFANSPLSARRKRLKSISLDSDNAKIIEQHLNMPITKNMKQIYPEYYDSDNFPESFDKSSPEEDPKTLQARPDVKSFIEMPRFSPKEFEVLITEPSTSCEADKRNKNLRNLTIDLSKKDEALEKELIEFEKLYTDAEEKKVRTPTLKVKATSLDSSEGVSLTLPPKNSLDIQNSISVPNTPRRQQKRLLSQQKKGAAERRLLLKPQQMNFSDSGVFLRENHAALMVYQPTEYSGSFDENSSDEKKHTFSVSSTNLKTLPEGVTSSDFVVNTSKKLLRKSSNQNTPFNLEPKIVNTQSSPSTSLHNLASIKNSNSNFSLNTDNRAKKLIYERRNSNNTLNAASQDARILTVKSETNVLTAKSNLLQRRGSNNSLSLNLQNSNTNLNRFSSNSSLSISKEGKCQKKGLLERRSSNTSMTLNIHTSNPQLSTNRGLSISNYNLNGSNTNLTRFNSNQSIEKKGILERRNSNTSLTLNINREVPRDVDVDEKMIQNVDLVQQRHRKSLSTENLFPKSYKARGITKSDKYGSHESLWSNFYTEAETQRLTCVGGDEENELIYALGNDDKFPASGFVRNITTKPLSPQTTSEDFKMYIANMQHLQNASNVLSREQLKDLSDIFHNGYSNVKCGDLSDHHHCTGRVSIEDTLEAKYLPCSEYQKCLLRNLHQEFWDLPTNFQEKPMVFGSHLKNRYKTILPNEHSRFILKDDNTETYINANYIKGHEYSKNSFIATQGPMQNTIYEFWLMVRQNILESSSKIQGSVPIQKIVMLTNFIENNKQKCERYFPTELNDVLTFTNDSFDTPDIVKESDNSFTIKNEGVISKTGYTVRKLRVIFERKSANIVRDESLVYHYWFHQWADHKCPKDVSALLNLSLDVLKTSDYNFEEKMSELSEQLCKCDIKTPTGDYAKFVFPVNDIKPSDTVSSSFEYEKLMKSTWETDVMPIIVHCSAGIGRTGCLIAILNGIQQLNLDCKVDILGIVCNMRLNRGGMVQNSEQYELIHKVLCLYSEKCLWR